MNLSSPESVGMSTERLNRIAPIMEAFVKDNRLPGIMTLVQRRGKVVHFGRYGLMDIASGRPMQEDGIFRIYSMTKPIISVAIMLLFEEGRLSLTDPVARYIPAFAKTPVFAGAAVDRLKYVPQDPPMNVHHLLTHMAGLSYGWSFDSPIEDQYRVVWPQVFQRSEQSLQAVIERFAELPLLYQPGTQWRYSIATDVLGYLVEVISDMPLADFLEARIFRPLGMTDTAFSVPAAKVSRLATLYASPALYDPQTVPPADAMLIGDVTVPTRCPSGGGGLTSTLPDYLSFCSCLLNRGAYEGGRLLSRKTLDWMTADHVPASLLPIGNGTDIYDHGFGLGFRVATDLGKLRSLRSVGEYGWGGAAQTYFWIDPAEEFIGLMMTQHLPTEPYPVQERFRNLAYQAIAD